MQWRITESREMSQSNGKLSCFRPIRFKIAADEQRNPNENILVFLLLSFSMTIANTRWHIYIIFII